MRSAPRLGELESVVLASLWARGEADVRAMHRAIGEPRGITSNTIQSTLERLHRKGLARRRKRGRAFCYRAGVSRGEWVRRCLEGLLETPTGGTPALLLATFVDLAEHAGADQLAELERLVRERRAQLASEEEG